MKSAYLFLCSLFFFTISTQAQDSLSCGLVPEVQQAANLWSASDMGAIRNQNFNCRSDTLNIIHYDLHLDLTDILKRNLEGKAHLSVEVLANNVPMYTFDLSSRFKVSEVLIDDEVVDFQHKKDFLHITPHQFFSKGDTVTITISYKGTPPSGSWDGFAYHKDVAYSVGSSFRANPHSFGRAFYPCFDSFRERATYTFYLKTEKDKMGIANGILTNTEILEDETIYTWELENEVPTYLTAISVGDFASVDWVYDSENGDLPIQLFASPKDTGLLKERFVNLDASIAALEYWWGPYAWEKVGFTVVPNLGGGMEHATNTTFGRRLLNVQEVAEEFMVHELAHSWMGNQITCETSEDMWINEGGATYGEILFTERRYGLDARNESLVNNFYEVVPMLPDEEDLPLAGVPHEFTFSSKYIYQRGAFVAHNLRGYLGDSLYRLGIRTVMEEYKYQPMNSALFRDALAKATGENLDAFFDDWVFSGGFLDVVIRDFEQKNETLSIHLEQYLWLCEDAFEKLPVRLRLYTVTGDYVDKIVVMNTTQEFVQLENIDQKIAYITISPERTLQLNSVVREEKVDKRANLGGAFMAIENNDKDTLLCVGSVHVGCADTIKERDDYFFSENHYWQLFYTESRTAPDVSFYLSAVFDWRLKSKKGEWILLYKPSWDSKEWVECETKYYSSKSGPTEFSGYLLYKNAPKGIYTLAKKRG